MANFSWDLGGWLEVEKELLSERFQGVVVSISGGLDSTALLQAIWHLHQTQKNFRLAAFHCAYGLRGSESVDDLNFCKTLAEERDIPFIYREITPEERLCRSGEGVQEWARRIRQEEFQRLARQGWIVALAHHRDDLAENVLMRLARGSGPGNLLGMQAWSTPYWRPLLKYPKEALRERLQAEGLSYREDSSNLGDAYSRNIIRHRILPELEALYPGAAARLVACAEDARDLTGSVTEVLETKGVAPHIPPGAAPGIARHAVAQHIKAELPGHRQLSRRLLDAAISGHAPELPGASKTRLSKDLCLETFGDSAKDHRQLQHQRGLSGPDLSAILEPSSYAYLTSQEGLYVLRTPEATSEAEAASANLEIQTVSSRQGLKFPGVEGKISVKNLMQRWAVPVKLRAKCRVLQNNSVTVGLFDGQKLHVPNHHGQKTGCSQLDVNLRYLKNGDCDRPWNLIRPE